MKFEATAIKMQSLCKAEAHRALELLENYYSRLDEAEEKELKAAIGGFLIWEFCPQDGAMKYQFQSAVIDVMICFTTILKKSNC